MNGLGFSKVPRGAILLVLLAAVSAGCGRSGPRDSVSGKVTLEGKAVAGEVVFVGPGNKEVRCPIALDGSYLVTEPTRGENAILVRGTAAPRTPKGIDQLPAPASSGAAPPARYARANNGLTFQVTGGKQTHNIELTP